MLAITGSALTPNLIHSGVFDPMVADKKRDADGILNPIDAGEFLRAKLRERGMQVQQLAERTTVKDANYISTMLSGRANLAKSKHLPSIARALRFSPEELAYLNPTLVVNLVPDDVQTDVRLPSELLEAQASLVDIYPDLTVEKVRSYLPRGLDGRGPQTVAEWTNFILMMRTMFN